MKGYGNFKGADKYLAKFDVGDRVRVVADTAFLGDEGRVVVRKRIDGKFCYAVDFETGGGERYFFQNELERIES